MSTPEDDFEGSSPYDLTVRLLVKGAELRVYAHTRRELCVLTETLLRDLHARGIEPRMHVEGHGAYRRIRIRNYLNDVRRELRLAIEPPSPTGGRYA